MTDEDSSKDEFFKRLGELSEAMIAAHGKDFTMGTLIIAARFIAEGKSLTRGTIVRAAPDVVPDAGPGADA